MGNRNVFRDPGGRTRRHWAVPRPPTLGGSREGAVGRERDRNGHDRCGDLSDRPRDRARRRRGLRALIAIRLLPLGAAVLAATVVAVIVVSFISTALSQIFRVADQYAVTGQAPGGFDGQTLQSAFEGRVTRYELVVRPS